MLAQVQHVGPAELEVAGVYDPDATDAPQRLALLEYLISLGASLDDLARAKPDELPLLASLIALWGNRESLTRDEAAAAAGVDQSLILRAWRAAGFPEPGADADPRVFSRRDVELFAIVGAAVEMFGEDVAIQLLRVIGAAAVRVADATVSAFVVNVASAAAAQDPSGLALARANADSMLLLDGVTQGFDTLLRHHIERGFRPVDRIESVVGVDLVHRSVGFADLVGSTSWTQQLDLAVLSQALTEFDSAASEIVVGHGGKVVKLIGDEIMFVTDNATQAVDIALTLIATFSSHELLPPVRAGVATGAVLARDGDFSGGIVNLAARAANVGGPSTLLVDDATRDALRDDPALACADTRSYSLKGFAEPMPLTEVARIA